MPNDEQRRYQEQSDFFDAVAKPDAQRFPTLVEVKSRLLALSVDIEFMKLLFATSSGLTVDFLEELHFPRKTKTERLDWLHLFCL